MSQLINWDHHKLLGAVAVAALAISCAWLWQQQSDLRRLHLQPVGPQLADSPYTPAGLQLPESRTVVWREAPAQSHGLSWIYEVFTPPMIYYDLQAESFTITPPQLLLDDGPPFGLELLGVKQELYRLQLVGYFGGPGDYLAAFTIPNLTGTLLARVGHRFDTSGLTLRSFDVKKMLVAHHDVWPVYDIAALAVLLDEKTGDEVVLDSRSRKFIGTPLAMLKLPAGDGRPREMHEGDSFSDGTSTYRVERIQLDPPEVAVVREAPGLSLPKIRILHPMAQNGRPVAAKAVKTSPGRSAVSIATNDK